MFLDWLDLNYFEMLLHDLEWLVWVLDLKMK